MIHLFHDRYVAFVNRRFIRGLPAPSSSYMDGFFGMVAWMGVHLLIRQLDEGCHQQMDLKSVGASTQQKIFHRSPSREPLVAG